MPTPRRLTRPGVETPVLIEQRFGTANDDRLLLNIENRQQTGRWVRREPLDQANQVAFSAGQREGGDLGGVGLGNGSRPQIFRPLGAAVQVVAIQRSGAQDR